MLRKHFGYSEFLAHAADGSLKYGRDNTDRPSSDSSWDDGISGREATKRALEGDTSYVGSYESFIKNIEEKIAPAARMGWAPSVAGSRVSVPAYLSGNPYNMRRRMVREKHSRHVNIYVGTLCSCGIRPDQMLRRGQAILGLLTCLERMQIAVDVTMFLYCATETENGLLTVKLDTQPLSMSSVGFALAHVAFIRNVIYGIAYREWKMTEMGWTQDYFNLDGHYHNEKDRRYENHVRELLGMKPEDLYIRDAYLLDPIIQTPEKWIEDTLERLK